MNKTFFTSMIIGLALLLASCGAGAESTPVANTTSWNVALESKPNPVMMGNAEVIITVTDANGAPVEGAAVEVSAEHTGHNMGEMKGTATEQGNGKYAINAGFSMSGSWKLTVNISKDGLTHQQEFEIPVQ